MFGSFDGLDVRFIQPVKGGRFSDAEGVEEQDYFGEIAALDLGCVAFLAAEVTAFGPQAVTGSSGCAARAPFALVSAGLADGFKLERADTAFGIVAGHAGHPAVNDVSNAIDGDAGLGDIGGDDDLAECVRGEGAILLPGLKGTVEGEIDNLFLSVDAAQGVESFVDLAASRHEDEDVAFLSAVDDLGHCFSGLQGEVTVIWSGEVFDIDRITLSFGDEDGAVVQIGGDRFGIEGGGHHEHGQIGALGLLQAFYQSEGDIAEEIALVEFVEDHRADIGESAVVLEPAQQDAFSDEADAGLTAGAIIEADLITHFSTGLGRAFRGDAGGHASGRDAAGLQNDNHFLVSNSGVEEHLRHLGGFSRTGGSNKDESVSGLQSLQNIGVNFPNGKRGRIRHEGCVGLYLLAGIMEMR